MAKKQEPLEVGCREEWATVPNTKGYYEVSNMGRVRSLDRVVLRSDGKIQTFKGRILKYGINRGGYLQVTCFKTMDVHVLVAKAFIPNPEGLPEVNHKNGIKADCRASNLEWKTHQGNMQHASENGLARGGSMPGSSHPCSKLDEAKVLEIRASQEKNSVLARRYGVSKVLIGYIKKRRNWTHV